MSISLNWGAIFLHYSIPSSVMPQSISDGFIFTFIDSYSYTTTSSFDSLAIRDAKLNADSACLISNSFVFCIYLFNEDLSCSKKSRRLWY